MRVAGDFDGDGKTDVALTGGNKWQTQPIAFSKGDGTFRVTNKKMEMFPSWANEKGPRPRFVAGDFNADGKADLALVRSTWSTLPTALSNGDGTFRLHNKPIDKKFLQWSGTAKVQVVATDVDGDKRTDIVLSGAKGWKTIPVAYSTDKPGSYRITNDEVPKFPGWAGDPGVKIVGGDFLCGPVKGGIAAIGPKGWYTFPVAQLGTAAAPPNPKLECTLRKSAGTGSGWSKIKAPGGLYQITGGGYHQKNTAYNKAAGVEQFSFDGNTYACDSGFGPGNNDCFGIYCKKGDAKALECQTKSCRVNRESKSCTATLDKGYVMTGGGLVNHYRDHWDSHSQFEQSRPSGNNGWLSDMGFGWGDFTSTVRGCKGLKCVTKISKQGDATAASCPIGYTLTGCGIQNDMHDFNKLSLFEYVIPDVKGNKCSCNMGAGTGKDKCYARCCKSA
jgi:hypothetical protein